jgi:hypothetical protein
MLAPGRKIFCHAGCRQRRAHAQQRRLVRCRYQYYRALPPLRPQTLLEKLAHLAPALAHQPHHNHFRVAVSCHHADERALANARPPKNAHALAAPHAQHAVDRANAGPQRAADRLPLERSRRRTIERYDGVHQRQPSPIQRLPHCVQYPPDQPLAHFCLRHHPLRANGIAIANAVRRVERHRQHARAADPNYFGGMRASPRVANLATFSHRTRRPFGLDGLSRRFHHAPPPAQRRPLAQPRKVGSQ